MIDDYSGALIEEFIEGKEFSALVIENWQDKNNPFVLPVECKFQNNESFKHFDLKWKEYDNITNV